jgi:hypothetical protein
MSGVAPDAHAPDPAHERVGDRLDESCRNGGVKGVAATAQDLAPHLSRHGLGGHNHASHAQTLLVT